MCGRYGCRADKQRIAEWFHTSNTDVFDDDYYEVNQGSFTPSYNIPPEGIQPVVRLDRDTGEPVLALMKWGLLPYLLVEDIEGKFQLHQCGLRQVGQQERLARAVEASSLPYPSQFLLRVGAAHRRRNEEEAQQTVGSFGCG
jgi:putative SOS response-associated peptidase YedK